MTSIYSVGSINISGMSPVQAFRIPGPYPLKAFEQTDPPPRSKHPWYVEEGGGEESGQPCPSWEAVE